MSKAKFVQEEFLSSHPRTSLFFTWAISSNKQYEITNEL